MEGSFGSFGAGPVTAALILGLAIGLVVIGALMLRRQGSAWRIGRLLAVAPMRSLADAATSARSGEERYIRIHGRIDSDEEFPGDDDMPLVFRRRRLQRSERPGRWQTIDEERLAVPFGLTGRGDTVRIDHESLGDGLIVVPRLSEGTAADVPPDAFSGEPPELPSETPVRLRIDRLSAVEHATAAGVPIAEPDGGVVLTAGLGRPLIVTPLDADEAMRVLGADRRGVIIGAGLLIALGLGLVPIAIIAFVVG